MEKQYCDGKEIIRKCCYCQKEGVETYMNETNQKIMDLLTLWDIEDKIQKDIAVISHGVCADCFKTLLPDYCHEQ